MRHGEKGDWLHQGRLSLGFYLVSKHVPGFGHSNTGVVYNLQRTSTYIKSGCLGLQVTESITRKKCSESQTWSPEVSFGAVWIQSPGLCALCWLRFALSTLHGVASSSAWEASSGFQSHTATSRRGEGVLANLTSCALRGSQVTSQPYTGLGQRRSEHPSIKPASPWSTPGLCFREARGCVRDGWVLGSDLGSLRTGGVENGWMGSQHHPYPLYAIFQLRFHNHRESQAGFPLLQVRT